MESDEEDLLFDELEVDEAPSLGLQRAGDGAGAASGSFKGGRPLLTALLGPGGGAARAAQPPAARAPLGRLSDNAPWGGPQAMELDAGAGPKTYSQQPGSMGPPPPPRRAPPAAQLPLAFDGGETSGGGGATGGSFFGAPSQLQQQQQQQQPQAWPGGGATQRPPVMGPSPPQGPPPSSIAAQLKPGPFPRVARMLPGPAGKLQALQAAGRLESATPEALGLSSSGADEEAQAGDSLRDALFVSATWRAAQSFAAARPGGPNSQPSGSGGGGGGGVCVKDARGAGPCKLDRMLLIVVDLKPSGGRGAFAKVKDPTGSMGAAVHQTVLEREPALGPGAALLLEGVPVFTPVPGVTYLCVVPQNVVKVFPATGPGVAPPLQHPADASYTQMAPPPLGQQQQPRPARPAAPRGAPPTPCDSEASAPAWPPPPSPGLRTSPFFHRPLGRFGGGRDSGGSGAGPGPGSLAGRALQEGGSTGPGVGPRPGGPIFKRVATGGGGGGGVGGGPPVAPAFPQQQPQQAFPPARQQPGGFGLGAVFGDGDLAEIDAGDLEDGGLEGNGDGSGVVAAIFGSQLARVGQFGGGGGGAGGGGGGGQVPGEGQGAPKRFRPAPPAGPPAGAPPRRLPWRQAPATPSAASDGKAPSASQGAAGARLQHSQQQQQQPQQPPPPARPPAGRTASVLDELLGRGEGLDELEVD